MPRLRLQGKRDESPSVDAAKAKAEAKVGPTLPGVRPAKCSGGFVKPDAGFRLQVEVS